MLILYVILGSSLIEIQPSTIDLENIRSSSEYGESSEICETN